MNISRAFRTLSFKKLEKCNHNPGYDDSCVPCKNCGKKRMTYEQQVPINECCSEESINAFDPYFNPMLTANQSISFYLYNTGNIPEKCCYDFQIRFDHSGGTFEGLVTINNYELTENEWYLLANICRGDEEILIEYINQSEQTINLHLKNKTCNHNYGTIGSITVNFSV